MVAQHEPLATGRVQRGKEGIEGIKIRAFHMLVKNIAGEKDHIGVQFPDAAVQLRDALAVHGTFAGVQVADLQHPQFAARQGLGGLQAIGGGNQAHSLEIAPEHHGGRAHPGQQAAHPDGLPGCLHRSADCTGQQAHNVPGDIQPGQMGVDDHAGAERVPPDPGHHSQQQQRQQQIHRRMSTRKAGHKRQFEKIQIQHHRHKGLANFGDGELDKMPVHCRTSVR